MNQAKLTTPVTVKLTDEDLEALDAEVRRRDAIPNAAPSSRSFVLRELLRERFRQGPPTQPEDERAG